MPSKKPFKDLTTAEATEIVRRIKNSSHSEEEIRSRLTKEGFNGNGAAVTSRRSHGMFSAMIMVCGPNGETIS